MNYLTPQDNFWGLDVETNGLDATKIWVCCLINFKTKERLHFRDAGSFKEWLKTNSSCTFIGHNLLKADRPWLEKLWKATLPLSSCIDTFVLSQLFDPNLPKPEGLATNVGTHSLAAWGVRVGLAKGEFSDWSKYSEEMLDYCFQDVEVTLKVYKQLASKLKKLGFSEKSVELEHQVVPIIGKQQEDGFHFDKTGAQKLLTDLRGQQESLQQGIHTVFPPVLIQVGDYKRGLLRDGTPSAGYLRHSSKYHRVDLRPDGSYAVFDYKSFNIGSPAQRLEKLLELGYQATAFTPSGMAKVDEDALVEFAKVSGIKEVQYIADWLVLEGRANMIQTWLDNLGTDNRVHGNVFTCGAQSRRMKHSSPNTANIPGLDARYGKEARSLWIARPGRVLVGVDAASLEGRMLLHHLNNPDAEDFFVNKKPHRLNADAIMAAGVDIGKEAHAQYQKAKTLLYAFLYGASDRKLASTVNSSDPSVGALIRSTLAKNVPGLAELVKRVQKEYHDSKGLLRCIDGGFVRCPSSHAALNYKLQPDGAILMKQAIVLAEERRQSKKLDGFPVGNIHDEIQLDCRIQHATDIGELYVKAIEDAGELLNFNVKQSGEYKIGFNWSETH